MKIIEKTFYNQTFYTLIPKNKHLEFKEVFVKIKNKKKEPFHKVFLIVPLQIAYECDKAMRDNDISAKNTQANKNFVAMEIR